MQRKKNIEQQERVRERERELFTRKQSWKCRNRKQIHNTERHQSQDPRVIGQNGENQ